MADPASYSIKDANGNTVTFTPNADPAKGAKQDAGNALLTAVRDVVEDISTGQGALATQATMAGVLEKLTSPASFNVGQKAIAVTGTAVRLSTASVPLINGVLVQASVTNQSSIVVGASAVTDKADGTGNGKTLQPGQAWAFPVSNLNLLYINGAANDWADWSAN